MSAKMRSKMSITWNSGNIRHDHSCISTHMCSKTVADTVHRLRWQAWFLLEKLKELGELRSHETGVGSSLCVRKLSAATPVNNYDVSIFLETNFNFNISKLLGLKDYAYLFLHSLIISDDQFLLSDRYCPRWLPTTDCTLSNILVVAGI